MHRFRLPLPLRDQSGLRVGQDHMADIDWTFEGTWPFEPKWFETAEGRLHYIDEGPRDGPPVIMVHGNPTWGYLWRNFVPPLVDAGFRTIVPDHLGFGRSDKPDNRQFYRIPRHALHAFVRVFLFQQGVMDKSRMTHRWFDAPIWLRIPRGRLAPAF